MSREEIVLISIGLSTIVMIIYMGLKRLLYKHMYKKGVNRVIYVKQLLKNEEIDLVLINIDNEPNRVIKPDDDIGLIIDGEFYDNKNSYFLEEEDRIYVVGKKKDYVIALMGSYIGRR